MSPKLATDDLADVALGDTDRKADSGLCFSACPSSPDFQDFGLSQLGRTVVRPASAVGTTSARSSFGVPVGVIVGRSAQPQMVDSHTRWVVAVVKNPKPIRNGAVVQFPRKAMHSSIMGANFHDAVTIFVGSPLPFPAAASLSDFSPEPCFMGDSWGAHIGFRRTVASPPVPVGAAQPSGNYGTGTIRNRTRFHDYSLAREVAI